MIEAVFISDLHLHPNQPLVYEKFIQFVDWATDKINNLYILGDFFHAWAGDDDLEPWNIMIAEQLLKLRKANIAISFLPGNRDFLLGETFTNSLSMHLLKDPSLIELDHQKVLLTHGDAYCSLDKSHQYFRALTRNAWFKKTFLKLPLRWRKNLVDGVRNYSRNKVKMPKKLAINTNKLLKDMQFFQVNTVIHGHIHTPVINQYRFNQELYYQYVLSDWDDKPFVLCYDKTNGFEFIHI